MKPVKKILALILAGVMALALLTGCGKATSLNRTMAEGIAEYYKSSYVRAGNKNNISVSYQVPELSHNIAPLFDETWITEDEDGFDALTDTAKETLTDILGLYISATSAVTFVAADVTDVKTPFMETSNLTNSNIMLSIPESLDDHTSVTSLKIEVTHKTVNGRTYALAVMVAES